MMQIASRAVLSTALLFVPLVSQAADVLWNNPAGGSFSIATNWLGNASPTAFDATVFDLSTTGYTVTLDHDQSVAKFLVGDDSVTLDFGAHTLFIAGDPAQNLRVGHDVGDVALLRIISGQLMTNGLGVAAANGSTGVLELDGPETRLEVVGGYAENQIGGGDGDSGELRVMNGAEFVTSTNLQLARNGGNGTVVVSGDGSRLISTDKITVGMIGHGELYVSNNGFLQAPYLEIAGQDVSPSGKVVVESGGRIEIVEPRAPLVVGRSGYGELLIDNGIVISESQLVVGANDFFQPGDDPAEGFLSISNGGVLDTRFGPSGTRTSGLLANFAGSTGRIVVTGAGSKWLNDGLAVVGWLGTGSMDVEQGGLVESVRGQLGRFAGSSGTVQITDAGSTWQVSQDLTVGGTELAQGGPGELTVLNGGRVTVGEKLRLWNTGIVDLSGGGSIDVGASSSPPAAGTLKVGTGGTLSGTGTIVGDILVDGGIVEPGSSPGSLHVTGNYHQLTGSTLSLEIGGTVPGTDYDQLLVTGELLLDGVVQVSFINGFLPQVGNSFDLFSAVTLTNTATFNFLNAPSAFDFSTAFANGVFSVTVTAVPEPSSIILGASALIVLVGLTRRRTLLRCMLPKTYSDKSAPSMSNLCPRVALTTALLSVPLVSQAADVLWNNPAGGDYSTAANWSGNAVPSMADSAIFNLQTAGYTVTSFADIQTSGLFIRTDDVALDLGSSSWTMPQNNTVVMRIGQDTSDVGKLTLRSGTIHTGRTIVGYGDHATGELIIDGQYAHFAILNSALFAGGIGDSMGHIEVRNGGMLSVSGIDEPVVYIAPETGTQGSVLVTGDGSILESEDILIGERGRGTLDINDGGRVTLSSRVILGMRTANPQPTAHGILTIGAGGTLEAAGQVQVGGGANGIGGRGEVFVENGGILKSGKAGSGTGTSGIIAFLDAESTGYVHVSGIGSKWIQDGLAVVGWEGNGSLDVSQGGLVESARGQLGRFAGSSGTVEITDAGSTWQVSQDLTVGGTELAQGGTGELKVSNSGRVSVGERLRLWNTGSVDLSGGGSIDVGTPSSPAGAGILKVATGGTLSGLGTIVGDILVDGGFVEPGSSPGSLHVTGNYQQLAGSTLSLEIGGTVPGTDYDQLLVTGDLLIEGVVQVSFINGFLPQVGDAFDLFSAGTLTDAATFSFLNAPSAFDYSTSFANGVFSVTVTAVPEPAGIVLGLSTLALLAGRFRGRSEVLCGRMTSLCSRDISRW